MADTTADPELPPEVSSVDETGDKSEVEETNRPKRAKKKR